MLIGRLMKMVLELKNIDEKRLRWFFWMVKVWVMVKERVKRISIEIIG